MNHVTGSFVSTFDDNPWSSVYDVSTVMAFMKRIMVGDRFRTGYMSNGMIAYEGTWESQRFRGCPCFLPFPHVFPT